MYIFHNIVKTFKQLNRMVDLLKFNQLTYILLARIFNTAALTEIAFSAVLIKHQHIRGLRKI